MGYCAIVLFGENEIRKFQLGQELTNFEKIINQKKYEFETFAERDAFYKGISETVGWLDCLVIKEFEINLKPKEEPDFDYWGFIEKYYPKYYNCNNILLSDILTRKLNGEHVCKKDRKYIKNWDVRKELLELDKELLSIAFENYFNSIYPENEK